MALVNVDNFGAKLAELADAELSTTETQKLIDTTREKLNQTYRKLQKAKEARRELDLNDAHYDSKYESYSEDIDYFFDMQIELGETLDDAEAKLDSIKKEALSRESVYANLEVFHEYYDRASDTAKKKALHEFISGIELYPEKSRKNGCFIKSISFKFPVSYKGEPIYTIHLPKPEIGEDGKVSPPYWDNVESVVTLVKVLPL